MIVVLGNRDARDLIYSPLDEARRRDADSDDPGRIYDHNDETARLSIPAKGKRATWVGPFPEGVSLGEAFTTIIAANGVWVNQTHSDDSKPAWVASDSPGLAALLGEHYDCEVRELEYDAEPVEGDAE